MADHYIVEHDGTYYAHAKIPYGSTGEVLARREVGLDGPHRRCGPGCPSRKELTGGDLRPAAATQRADWWEVGGIIPTALVIPMKPKQRVTGYRLPEGIHLDQFPDYMTADEMKERREGLDEDDVVACGPLQMYEAEREEVPVEDTVIDLTDHVLLADATGSLLAEIPADAAWHGSLPSGLNQYPEYGHLFPGHLSGFAKWFATEVEKFPTVKNAYGFRDDEISVFPKSGFGGRWEKKGRNIDRVQGTCLADAIANWHARALSYGVEAGVFREACPTCTGKGYVE